MAIDVRDQLDERCNVCGKLQDKAEEIIPVTTGRWSLEGSWYCGDCI